jgi:S-adenosylmethionine synthetase
VRATIASIGYDDPELGFDADGVTITDLVGEQSPEIAAGVDVALESRGANADDQLGLTGAGDQGMMFGFATKETPELLPMPIALAHRLARQLAAVRRDGTIPWLRPDGKTQVTLRYVNGRPVGVHQILISAQHSPEMRSEYLREALRQHVIDAVDTGPLSIATASDWFLVNPSGRFTVGGPAADSGLTGRKIIVDTYGGMAPHGGGAFSGKDPSKVDRSGAYAARYVAVNVVAAGLARRCLIQVAYAIGVAEPVSLSIDTFGTCEVPEDRLEQAIHQVFDLRPGAVRAGLDLDRPIYLATAAYGHFGRTDLDLPWERRDRAAELRAAARS